MRILTLLTLYASILLTSLCAYSIESEPTTKPGVKTLQLVSDHASIQPGKPFSIGLFIQHLPEYHTYWKAPGIVGVPTTITWELPQNFAAGQIEWPVPELTKMAQYTAYGYEKDALLLTEITAPNDITGDTVTIKARIAFMCCAKMCNPGWHDFELTFPVNRNPEAALDEKWNKAFIQCRAEKPGSAPEKWSMKALESKDEITLEISSDETFAESEKLYCFSEDNQIDSDQGQGIKRSEDGKKLTFSLIKSGFGPKNLQKFSGLLYHPNGWPGTSANWVSFSVPFSPVSK